MGMDRPTTRPFHLHFNTPNVSAAERRLESTGLPLRRRFGRVDGEFAALEPDDAVPEAFGLRLQTHQRGYVNLTVAPGRRAHFDHLGLCTSEFDAVVGRVEEAEDAGWSIRDPEGRRPFVMTPWGFRVELHRDGSDVESDLGAWSDAHLAEIRLAVPEPDAVREGLEAVFGAVPGLAVERGERERAWVPAFRVEGDAFERGEGADEVGGVDVDAAAILG